MLDILTQPWPWYVGGPLIGLMIPTLLYFSNKQLGISSSLQHFCAATVPGKIEYFKYNWRNGLWNIIFVLGILIGGFIGGILLKNPDPIVISEKTYAELSALGISNFTRMIPLDIFNWNSLLTLKGFILIIFGGFLVGFGTRYANGCTSGHSIMGMSNLQWSSLVATTCFFIGGLITTHFLFPFIFKL